MSRRPQGIALCAAALTALAGLSGVASANTGTVTQLSGTLSVKKADGSVRILSQKSQVETGDTLSTELDSYAQIKFSDGAQLTLKPNSSVKIQSFRFAQERPQDDSFVYSLLKGGLRAVTGIVGKRSKDKYELETATATVGIRGTTLSADDCLSDRAGECARLDSAVYIGVSDGEVVVRNGQGELGLAAGQFGLIAPNQRPLFLSTDPGLNNWTTTPQMRTILSFGGSAGGGGCVVVR
jgi:hypothetical protein